MENMMLTFAPIGFFALTGLIACIALGWLLHDMLPLLKARQTVDLRRAARRAAYVRPRPALPGTRAIPPVTLRAAA